MTQGQPNTAVENLPKPLDRAGLVALADGQWLEQFVSGCDEMAFEKLLPRHGPMVVGVCRRILHDLNYADDRSPGRPRAERRKAPVRLVPGTATASTDRVLVALGWAKLKAIVAALLVVTVIAVSAGVLTQ